MKYKTERQLQKKFLLKEGDYKNIKDMLIRVAKYLPNKPLLAELNKEKEIVYHTATDILNDVVNLGDGLLHLGLENKHIAIMAENSYLYVIADTCISSGVGVITPIDKDAPQELLETLLKKCDADAIICSSSVLKKVKEAQKNYKSLKTIITIDKKVDNFYFIDKIIEKGKSLGRKVYLKKKLNLDKPSKILFTSGTTGANKGVVLSQRNLIANTINCMDTIRVKNRKDNTSMSILPMHHATEINTHIMARIACGRLTYINDNMKNMMTNLCIFKPTNITIVPMIVNAFYKTIWQKAEEAGKAEKLKKGIKLCNLLNKVGIDITHKLFKDVYAPFGGNLCQIVVGGAMLNPQVVQGMKDLGIYIINGYGITECGPLVSMNAETYNDYESVGYTAPSIKTKVINKDENGIGELCIKGASVASSYYKDEEATKKAFTSDGYFNTGDLARISEDGKIYLTGRKKNSIVLSNGKNIYPEEIENLIENSIDYTQDVVVYLSQINKHEVLCAGLFIKDEKIRAKKEKIKNDFLSINEKLPNYKRIHFINLAEEEYAKTSTRKIKRNTVLDKHNQETGIKL